MDDNGRLAIPARLRKARPRGVSSKKIVKGYILARWLDGCLALFIESEWNKKLNKLDEQDLGMTREGRIFNRHLSNNTYEVTPDSQGRIVIPKKLMEVAYLQGDTLVVGVSNHIEIWNPQRYEHFFKESMSFEESVDKLFAKKS
jgi:MraZ protein